MNNNTNKTGLGADGSRGVILLESQQTQKQSSSKGAMVGSTAGSTIGILVLLGGMSHFAPASLPASQKEVSVSTSAQSRALETLPVLVQSRDSLSDEILENGLECILNAGAAAMSRDEDKADSACGCALLILKTRGESQCMAKTLP